MTTETLLPFDPEIAEKHPERVRDRETPNIAATRIIALDSYFAIWWADGAADMLNESDARMCLRLAPPEPKTVRVRAWRDWRGDVCTTKHDVDEPYGPSNFPWASDPVEIPLYPQEDA